MHTEDIVAGLKTIGLGGVADKWGEFLNHAEVLKSIIAVEQQWQKDKKFNRLKKQSLLGSFKPIAEFDWNWPQKISKASVLEAIELRFMASKGNIILVGGNGSGKTMIAKNIGWESITRGNSTLFISASVLLNDLQACTETKRLESRLKYYANYGLLVIDELGYLSFASRHADLLFQLIDRRHEKHSTVITTNKPFSEWNTIFPNSASVGAMIDRLIQYGDVIAIDADSYRLKVAQERTETKKQSQSKKNSSK